MKQFITFAVIFSLLLVPFASAGITGMSHVDLAEDTIFDSDATQMWVLNWNAMSTDYVSGTLHPSDFESQTGTASKQDFSLKMEAGDSYVTYAFYDGGLRDIYRIELINKDFFTDSEMQSYIYENCADFDGDGLAEYTSVNYYYYQALWCAKETDKLASIARISPATSIFTTDWIFEIEDEVTKTLTVSNGNNVDDDTRTKLGNAFLVKWQGSLSTGQYPPSAGGKVLAAHTNNFADPHGWRIIDDDHYDSWKNHYEGMLSEINSWAHGNTAKTYIENNANDYAERAVQGTSDQIWEVAEITGDESKYVGSCKIDLDDDLDIPSFQVFINADYLELNVPAGEPKIISVSDVELGEIGFGKVTAVFKNTGGSTGDFEAKIFDCTSGFSAVGTKKIFNIPAGNSVTKTFDVKFTSTSDNAQETGTCKVQLMERTTGVKKTMTFDLTGIQEEECTPNEYFRTYENNVYCVYKCSSDGMTETQQFCCESDEYAKRQDDGTYECVEENGNGNGNGGLCAWWDVGCHFNQMTENMKAWFEDAFGFFEIFKWMVAGLVFTFSSIAAFGWIEKRVKHKGAVIASTIAIGAMLAIITYFYLMWGILLFVIYLVLRAILSYVIPIKIKR